MRIVKWLLAAIAALLLLAAAAMAFMLQQHPSLAPYAALKWSQPAPVAPGLKVSFLGVATLLLDDGETALMTDGFFSRPGKLQTALSKVEPELDAITRGLARAGVPARTGRLAAVIPVHSHYDHAMDAPEVAKRTGALLIGSESTANVGRGWGLPESQIRVAKLGVPMQFGRFTVTLYPGRHAPTGFTGGEITQPLTPPARVTAWQEGMSYAVLVQHDGKTLLINGSAGFEPGALKDVRADVVFLGIGSLGPRGEAHADAYWREVVTAVKARRVIPIHWDDFWIPSDQPMKPIPPPLDRFTVSMDFLVARAAKEGVEVRLPAEWQPMDPWAGLK